mmetsp:Transcript_52111/g.103514  ORF Transcript_52111/g.103514 Transcript_52111/m.103514 type:complete len:223 (+) Transcript_52111:173-841(+)
MWMEPRAETGNEREKRLFRWSRHPSPGPSPTKPSPPSFSWSAAEPSETVTDAVTEVRTTPLPSTSGCTSGCTFLGLSTPSPPPPFDSSIGAIVVVAVAAVVVTAKGSPDNLGGRCKKESGRRQAPSNLRSCPMSCSAMSTVPHKSTTEACVLVSPESVSSVRMMNRWQSFDPGTKKKSEQPLRGRKVSSGWRSKAPGSAAALKSAGADRNKLQHLPSSATSS